MGEKERATPASAAQSSVKTAPLTLLQGDPDNPRQIGEDNAKGLGVSMHTFGDLSGITFNRRSGHLVGGHQRVDQLREAGATEVVMDGPDRGYIEHPETGERFGVRFVDWDMPTQRMANLAANNPGIQGEFTPAAIEQLREMEGHAQFEALQLDALAKQLEKELGAASSGELGDGDGSSDQSGDVKTGFAIIIECQSEQQQLQLLDRFMSEGLSCRALT